MYKIEKFLLDHKFKLEKEWDSGVNVYTNIDIEPAYVVEVAIYTEKCEKNKFLWEATIYNPYGITLGSYRTVDKKACRKTHRLLSDDHVDYAFGFEEWLKEIDNPWEVIK